MKKRSALMFVLCLSLLFSLLLPTVSAAGSGSEAIIGDVNSDGAVNTKDITALRRYLAGGYNISIVFPSSDPDTDGLVTEDSELSVINFDDESTDFTPADVNGDGTINTKDITTLRRYLAGGYGIELKPAYVNKNFTLNLKNETTLYKTYGRCYMEENGVNMLWPGNAIEFTAKCEGDVMLNYTSSESIYVRVYVDGAEVSRPLLPATTSNVIVASGIENGVHTIRIVRDSDISKSSLPVVMRSVTLKGVKSSVTAPAEKSLLIEYVGDSITSGKYTMPDEGNGSTHSATLSYAYLTSQALDADWICTSRGGIAFIKTTENGGGSCPKTMTQCYDYVNPFAADADLIEYGFDRKADVVILALGTNDSASGATFQDATKAMIDQIRARNGEDVKIVVLYGMMTLSHKEDLQAAAEAKGAYFLQVTQDRKGYDSSHPSAAGHQVIASELTSFLESIL